MSINKKNLNKTIGISMVLSLTILAVSFLVYENKKESIASNSVIKEEQIDKTVGNLYLEKSVDSLSIFVKGSRSESDRYIGYNLSHSKFMDEEADLNPNYDVWTIKSANEYRLNKYGNFTLVEEVTKPGEWEMAVKEKGANDFIGGVAHGDEVTTFVELKVNGEEYDLGKIYSGEVETIEFSTISDLFRDNTMTSDFEQIGTHEKKYEFTEEGLVIVQSVKFMEDMLLSRSYLTMLPIFRLNEDGEQITDTAFLNPEGEGYDVSEENFDEPDLRYKKGETAWIEGSGSGISAHVEILEKGTDIPTTFYLSNSPNYNKFYFSYNDSEYRVSAGEEWTQKSKYMIDTAN